MEPQTEDIFSPIVRMAHELTHANLIRPLLRFTTEIASGIDEFSNYVTRYDGDILTPDEHPLEIGTVSFVVLNPTQIILRGFRLSDVMDDHSSELSQMYEPLFRLRDQGTLKPRIARRLEIDDITTRNLVIVTRIELAAQYRGFSIGHEVIHTIIRSFCFDNAIMIAKPFPLQFSDYRSAGEPMDPEERTAFRKVRQFWSDLGFQRVDNSNVFVRLA
jgi:hypothetical protein